MTKRKRPANPEDLSDADLAEQLADDNKRREHALVLRSKGAFTLTRVRLAQERTLIYLEHLMGRIDSGLLPAAMLDYEVFRQDQLDAAEIAIAKVELLGGGIGPAGPPQARIVMPGQGQ